MRGARRLLPLVVLLGQAAHSGQGTTSAEWVTNTTNREGGIALHWTHVYEGKDTVTRIDFTPKGQPRSSLQVEGQPVFDEQKTMVALPYCADDGCEREIKLVDLVARKVLPSVTVPETGQIYLDCSWLGSVLSVTVESWSDGKNAGKSTHTFAVSGKR